MTTAPQAPPQRTAAPKPQASPWLPTVLMLGASFATLVILTVAGILTVRLLEPDAYGRVAYFTRLLGLARFVGTLGIGAVIIQDMSRAVTQHDRAAVATSFYSTGLVRVASGLVVALVMLVLGLLRNDSVFVWAGAAGCVASLSDFTYAAVQGAKRRVAAAALSTLQPLVLLGMIASLWPLGPAYTNPQPIYAAYLSGFALAAAVQWVALWGLLPRPSRGAFSLSFLRQRLVLGTQFFGSGLLNMVNISIIGVVLGLAGLFEPLAFFNAPLSLITMPVTLAVLVVTSVFYPDVVGLLAEEKRAQAAALYDQFVRTFTLLLALPAALVVVHAGFIITYVYQEAYAASIVPTMLMAPLLMLALVQQFSQYALFAAKRVRRVMLAQAVQFAWLLVVVGVCIVRGTGIPVTLAAGQLVAGLLTFVVMWWSLRAELPFQTTLARLAGMFGLALVVAWGVQQLIGAHLPTTLGAFLGVCVLSGLLYLPLAFLWLFGRAGFRQLVLEGQKRLAGMRQRVTPKQVS